MKVAGVTQDERQNLSPDLDAVKGILDLLTQNWPEIQEEVDLNSDAEASLDYLHEKQDTN